MSLNPFKRRVVRAVLAVLLIALPASVVFAMGRARVMDLNLSSSWPFPEYLWGVSNTAFESEGSPEDSDWFRWTHTPGKISDGSNADLADDFWNRFDEDFTLAQGIGLNAFRISIAWERVEPRPGQWDEAALAHYRSMIEAMRAKGLEPVVTLYHFVTPEWLAEQGGVFSPGFAETFAAFAGKVVSELSSGPQGAKIWLTINEPMVMALGEYGEGIFPPGVKNLTQVFEAAGNLAEAHIAAVREIRALHDPLIRVSIAQNWVRFFPKNPASVPDWVAVEQINEFYNHAFIQAAMTGDISFGVAFWHPARRHVDLPEGRPTLDFLGLNYYFQNYIGVTLKPPFFDRSFGPGPKTDSGWSIYPAGLKDALVEAYHRYSLPILVTENGIADASDQLRPQFLHDHLDAIDSARSEGVPVLGYLHWSLTDNFEWADGLSKRFGLVAVDYATGIRTPRASYFLYGDEIRARGRALSGPGFPFHP